MILIQLWCDHVQHEVSKKCKHPDSENKELKKYGRCLCLRIDGVSTLKDESNDDLLEFTKSLFKEANVAALNNVLDCAHRIGPIYMERKTNKKCKSMWDLPHSDTGLYSIGQEKI